MGRVPTVGVLGTPGGVLVSEHGLRASLDLVGENTGNLLFHYACARHIRNPAVYFQMGGHLDPDYLREAIDILCIPAANQLNPDWDLASWASLVETLDKPVVIVGLGAQSKIAEMQGVRLQPGTVRFLDTIRERAAVIGVRGASTQELLARYGVHNTAITGCPSNFINANVDGASIAQRLAALREKSSPRINLLAGTLEDYSRSCERVLFQMAMVHPGRIIYQTNLSLMKFLEESSEDPKVENYVGWENGVVAPELGVDAYRAVLRSRGAYFFDVRTWIDSVARDDLSIGMRIHGAVAAIQGGSLGVCVAFDARTLELAETMGYPYVMAEELARIQDFLEIEKVCRFSAADFDAKRQRLRATTKELFERGGIRTTL